MLILFPFCHKDALSLVNLLEWKIELDGRDTTHRCLLVGANGTDEKLVEQVMNAATRTFLHSRFVRTSIRDERGWPRSCNTLFSCAAHYVQTTLNCPFWWNEPDCIPLKPGAYDALEAEYNHIGKPFMGAVVKLPLLHLTGCALYPADVHFYNPFIVGQDNATAWDCVRVELILPHTHHTRLFHHHWFDPGEKVPTFPDTEKLSIISPDAVIYHRVKDGSLIARLREQKALAEVSKPVERAVKPSRRPVRNNQRELASTR